MAVTIKSLKGGSLLHKAAVTSSVEQLQSLLDSGLHVNSVDVKGRTPLHYAACVGFYAGVELLLNAGADINSRCVNGNTPLHYAAWNRRSAIFKILIGQGADVNCQNQRGLTVLHIAILWGKVSFIVPVLLQKETVNVGIKDLEGNTPLHFAARYSNIEIINGLLSVGADINCKNNRGNTPLHFAAKYSNIEIVNSLLRVGADINCKNNRGQTPLHYAATRKQKLVIRTLLIQGSEVNAKDRDGKTPMHYAFDERFYTSFWKEGIIKELLEWGSSLLTKDENQEEPLDLAVNLFAANNAFKMHSIQLNCIQFTLDAIKQLDFLEYKPYNDFYISCLEEVERMKEHKFDQNLLIDVFRKFNDPTYLSNTKLKEAVYSDLLETEFPIYATFLRATFQRAKKRSLLLDKACYCSTDILPLVPEVVRYILSYVTDDDLHNVVKAFEIEMLSSQNQAYLEVPV